MLELHKQVTVDPKRKAQDEEYGAKLFEAGQFIDYCTTIDQRRGWRNAMNAFAYADGNAHLVQRGIDAKPDANTEEAYKMGIVDRDLGLPSHASDYADDYDRAAYLAGKCAAKRVLSADEILRELEQLREAMDDIEFWRLGQW
jgi:hypothetical protein